MFIKGIVGVDVQESTSKKVIAVVLLDIYSFMTDFQIDTLKHPKTR
jgi:hypothetical protein